MAKTTLRRMLARHAWGNGYATEGANAAMDWAWSVLNAERLISVIHHENTASMAVAQRLGLDVQHEEAINGQRSIIYGADHPVLVAHTAAPLTHRVSPRPPGRCSPSSRHGCRMVCEPGGLVARVAGGVRSATVIAAIESRAARRPVPWLLTAEPNGANAAWTAASWGSADCVRGRDRHRPTRR
jgi:Acetyltransferase (GNAT) domain